MPYIYNFSDGLSETYTVSVDVKGWKSPVDIEYVVAQVNEYDPLLSVVWRVKGTTHSFVIPQQRLNVISHGNYNEHFKKALEAFREDYLSWFREKEYELCEWKYDYKEQFGKFIIE
jgi:hypothetical protein